MDENTEQSLQTPEAAIVFRAREGDREAITELFNRLHQPLLNYLYRMLGYRQEVEDIGQEAFIRAFERLDQLGPPWDFKSWLFRIASNLAVDFLRSEQRFMSEDEIELVERSGLIRPTERRIEQEEQRQTIWKTLDGLPTSYRQALLLRETSDFSYEQIAEALECTLENARQMVHRARQRFQDFYWLAVTATIRPQPCQALESLLTMFPPGKLNQQQLSTVQSHVASCSECSERRKSLAGVGVLLAGLPPFLPSDIWKKMVLEQIWNRLTSLSSTTSQPDIQEITQEHSRLELQRGEPSSAQVVHSSQKLAVPTGKGGMAASHAPKTWLYLIGLGAIPLIGLAILLGGLIFYNLASTFLSNPGTPAFTSTSAVVMASTESLLPEARPTSSPTVTASASPTPTYTATPTMTMTPTPPAPMASFLQNSHCRKGPGTDYGIVTSLFQGATALIEGRNQDSSWWWIRLPESRGHCWVWSGLVETSGNLSGLPLIAAPPLPEPSPTVVQGCWVYVPNSQKNVCTVPCPANAKPGGVCTP